MNDMNHIAIVEDEIDIANLIKYNLEKEGFKTTIYKDCESFLESEKEKFSLLILDIMLPGMSGLELLKKIRKVQGTEKTPVIIITAKDSEIDKVLGLELGADDYVTKPFSIRELVARVKAVLRRTIVTDSVSGQENVIKFKELRLYPDSYKAEIGKDKIDFTKTEFMILKILLSQPDKVFTRDLLLEKLWGNEKIVVDRTIDVHIKRVRDKIKEYGKHLKTIRGVGYSFSTNED